MMSHVKPYCLVSQGLSAQDVFAESGQFQGGRAVCSLVSEMQANEVYTRYVLSDALPYL